MVGLGYGKAKGVPMAIEKASKEARGQMFRVSMVGDTVAHRAVGTHKAAKVLLMPATPGTGVKAGGTVRAIMQVLGVHNVLSKVFGPTNPVNVARATMQALAGMRSKAEVERLRSSPVMLFHPQVTIEKRVAQVEEPQAGPAEEPVAEEPSSAE